MMNLSRTDHLSDREVSFHDLTNGKMIWLVLVYYLQNAVADRNPVLV